MSPWPNAGSLCTPLGGGRPRLLDLFCCAGGAATGYHRAGFEVIGVDIEPQPHYPFEFHQADAMTFPLDGFDAVHASPPCQDHSSLKTMHNGHGTGWMLDATLDRLRASGLPWIVENVEGAPLAPASNLFGQHGVLLCGTMFGLAVLRHRLFESSFPLTAPPHGPHVGEFYSPAGHGDPNWKNGEAKPHLRGAGYADRCRAAMGIDWMNRDELAQAIPPAYTEHLGHQLLEACGRPLATAAATARTVEADDG